MPTLTQYLTQTQRLLGTKSQQNLYTTADLTDYINAARNQVAIEGQCVRALPPTSGAISTITLTSGGTGWGACGVVITAPDSPSGAGAQATGAQASANATSAAGHITAVTVLSGGAGYFAPVVTFSGVGQGTLAVATISGINQTVVGQEVYPFADVNPMVATSGSGVASVFMVKSISVIFGNYRYTMAQVGFSKYQAVIRNYNAGLYQYAPAVFAQFGQGLNGSVYAYPVPNAPYQWEWDVCCTVTPLATDSDPDAIPYPWTDAVAYYAAYLALDQSQRLADAKRRFEQFEMYMRRARGMSTPGMVSNWYGRG